MADVAPVWAFDAGHQLQRLDPLGSQVQVLGELAGIELRVPLQADRAGVFVVQSHGRHFSSTGFWGLTPLAAAIAR